MHRNLFLVTLVASLVGAAAVQASPNLVLNQNFQDARTPPEVTRSGGGYTTTDSTGVDPHNLVGYAAARDWLTWTGQVGGRVRTQQVPSDLYGPGRFMLHVQVLNAPGIAGIDQVFLPIHTGPKHADFCALVKVVSGTVGLGANDQGNGGFTTPPVGATGDWVAVRGSSSTPPVNQVFLYAVSPDADFYVQNVTLTADPIAPKDCVAPKRVPYAPNETLVKPDPYPWTLHPEQSGQGSASGYFENMRPAQGLPPSPAETEDHEQGHGHDGGKGGGKGTPATPNTPPPSPNQLQQNRPRPISRQRDECGT